MSLLGKVLGVYTDARMHACIWLLITTPFHGWISLHPRNNYVIVKKKSISLLIQYRLFQYIIVTLTFMWPPGSPSPQRPCVQAPWDIINLRPISASFSHIEASFKALTPHSPWDFELQIPVKFGVCQGPAGRRDTHMLLARASSTGLCTGGSLISTLGWQNWVVRPSVLLAINPFLSWFKRQDETARKIRNQKLLNPGLQLTRIEKSISKRWVRFESFA